MNVPFLPSPAMEFCQEGCGCNTCMGQCADILELITPVAETSAQVICCLGSPLAFPLIFCLMPTRTPMSQVDGILP